MPHTTLGRLPGSRLGRSTYTWQTRRRFRPIGIAMMAVLCLLALVVGASSPLTGSAASGVWTYAGQRSAFGQHLRTLAPGNLVANAAFAADGEDALPGWSYNTGRPGSTVRAAHIFNTPPGTQLLEIVPRDGDWALVSQWVDVPGGDGLTFAFAAHALSTMGDARVFIRLADVNGKTIGILGWTMVGQHPTSTATERWFDHRTRANFQGGELVAVVDLERALREVFRVPPQRLGQVGIFFYASDGQHLLVESVYLGPYPAEALHQELTALAAAAPQPSAPEPSGAPASPAAPAPAVPGLALTLSPRRVEAHVGQTFELRVTLTNQTESPLGPLQAVLHEPYGFGVVATGAPEIDVGVLRPGESRELIWQIQALRAHAVNLDKPWPLSVSVGLPTGERTNDGIEVFVTDPRPGRLFYVLTDDLEPMDSAGYPTRFTGNRNAWLDPEEFRVQLIEKSEAMNRIADRYGAKWSHYIAWPAVVGAEWAATQSRTGAWDAVLADLRASIVREASKGHQYTPHLHMDYDYRLPHTFLSYHEPTDGYWANHREHGWAHQIRALGTYEALNSRIGTLFDYLRRLDGILREAGAGQQLATRVGSFDFGDTPEEQRLSILAFRSVGLYASSDAHGNVGGATSAPYGQNLYWTRPDSINQRAERLDQVGIVQFLPTPARAIMFEGETVASANGKVDEAVRYYTQEGLVKPGVHSIVAFTHAMFLLGDGDWRSTEGGAFAVLDEHLAYVREQYVDRGLIEFGTSNEMILAWLDYYTPQLLAVRGPEMRRPEPGVYEYPIILVGRDIPVGGRFRHEVAVQYPLYLADTVAWVGIYRDGELIAEFFDELPTKDHTVTFTVDRPGTYSMLVIEALEG